MQSSKRFVKFSPEEDKTIRIMYPITSAPSIAEVLQRNEKSVRYRIKKLGLHKGPLPIELEERILNRAKTSILNIEQIANEFHLSPRKISRILHSHGIVRKRVGWKRERDIFKGFEFHGNRTQKSKAQLLWAYKNTCWDCRKTLLPTNLVVHHDWSSLPVKVLILCRDCHKKRHGVVNNKPLF